MAGITIKIYPISAFFFELEEAANDVSVEVLVNYYITNNKDNIASEAWLHTSQNKTVMFLADVCSFAYINQSEDEIENYLLDYYNNSETFENSINALLNKQYDYFTLEDE